MYRLMLYFLSSLFGASLLFSLVGVLPYSPLAILIQGVIFVNLCWILNLVASRILGATANAESSRVTGMILSAIIGPLIMPGEWLVLVVATIAAIASKYIFVWKKSHVFNPAAFGVLTTALLLNYPASWWIGSSALVPIVLVGGILILKKIRRAHMVIAYVVSYLGLIAVDALLFQDVSVTGTATLLKNLVLSSPLLYFAFVMLVDPLTSPRTRQTRIVYGILIGGILFSLQRFVSAIPFSFELSLLLGNVFALFANPHFNQKFTLQKKERPTQQVGNFWFKPASPFPFTAGQYLEFTLPHKRADARGVRRYFTIASSPTEPAILMTAKIVSPASTFKQQLDAMQPGDTIAAAHVAGDFVLPVDPNEKLAFIAGGIGVTPFRSQVKFLIDTNQKRDVVLLYSAKSKSDVVFNDIFADAEAVFGMKTIYVLSEEPTAEDAQTRIGPIDSSVIRTEIPDWQIRTFFVSGPEPMVIAMQKTLTAMGVSRNKIKRDYFPGYDS